MMLHGVCAVEAHACAHCRHDVSAEKALPGQPPTLCRCRCRLQTLLVRPPRGHFDLAVYATGHVCACRWDYGQVQYYQTNNLRIVQDECVARAR